MIAVSTELGMPVTNHVTIVTTISNSTTVVTREMMRMCRGLRNRQRRSLMARRAPVQITIEPHPLSDWNWIGMLPVRV